MVICLYGASSQDIHPDYFSGVEAFGRQMGLRGHALLFGGGDKGLMGAAARGVKGAEGRVIGVAPRFFNVDGVLYPHCDEFFYTDTMRQRKQILEDKADAFVAVPGGIGTFDELFCSRSSPSSSWGGTASPSLCSICGGILTRCWPCWKRPSPMVS